MPLHRLEELSWGEVRRRGHEGALFLLPMAPLEDHGPHLPSGVDLFLSEALARETAGALTGYEVVLYPPLALGSSRLKSPGCLRIRASTLLRAVEELGRELEGQGVRRAALLSAHLGAGHIAALEEACRRISRRRRLAMIAPAGRIAWRLLSGKLNRRLEARLGRPLTAEEAETLAVDFHGGAVETSLMLKYRPDLVADFYRELPPHPVERANPLAVARQARTSRGYFGIPSTASLELAEALAATLVEEGAEMLRAFLRGELDRSRSESGLWRFSILYGDPAVAAWALGGLALGLGLGLTWGSRTRPPS